MQFDFDRDAFDRTLSTARQRLLGSRLADGHWEGRLSSSPLSTAAAVFALASVDSNAHQTLIRRSLDWLAANCNDDGGWGDTVLSCSNISTTLLCWSAFAVAEDSATTYRDILTGVESWLVRHTGGLEPPHIVKAVNERYG